MYVRTNCHLQVLHACSGLYTSSLLPEWLSLCGAQGRLRGLMSLVVQNVSLDCVPTKLVVYCCSRIVITFLKLMEPWNHHQNHQLQCMRAQLPLRERRIIPAFTDRIIPCSSKGFFLLVPRFDIQIWLQLVHLHLCLTYSWQRMVIV